jgi:hypothetical protein
MIMQIFSGAMLQQRGFYDFERTNYKKRKAVQFPASLAFLKESHSLPLQMSLVGILE